MKNLSQSMAIIIGSIIIAIAILVQPFVGTGVPRNTNTGAGNEKQAVVSPGGDPVIDGAKKAGVKEKTLSACLADGTFDQKVTAHMQDAIQAGGTGTPFSVVIAPDGTHYPFSGALPLSSVESIVDAALAGNGPAPEGDPITIAPVTDEDYVRGDRNAAIQIVEYSDIDCPFCGRFHNNMKSLLAKRDDVAWIYRHFPLESIHPNARNKANAAECVGEAKGNDAYWEYLDYLFDNKG